MVNPSEPSCRIRFVRYVGGGRGKVRCTDRCGSFVFAGTVSQRSRDRCLAPDTRTGTAPTAHTTSHTRFWKALRTRVVLQVHFHRFGSQGVQCSRNARCNEGQGRGGVCELSACEHWRLCCHGAPVPRTPGQNTCLKAYSLRRIAYSFLLVVNVESLSFVLHRVECSSHNGSHDRTPSLSLPIYYPGTQRTKGACVLDPHTLATLVKGTSVHFQPVGTSSNQMPCPSIRTTSRWYSSEGSRKGCDSIQ